MIMSEKRHLIYLTGFSGTGKTTVGKLVADLLGWKLLDTDALIVKYAGIPIVKIFDRGEEHFRQIEHKVLKDLATQYMKVISTGGGLPADPRNRHIMKSSGTIVRLGASPHAIHRRLRDSLNISGGDNSSTIRPMIQDGRCEAPVERIKRLLGEREMFYAEADFTIDTEYLGPLEVARQIIDYCQPNVRQGA